ncbi:MAG: ATP-binding cassette domain-containing protein [Clostridia bacterium]|nr:ATP-binding cassette domain-containing protein [Clostridia bacterium]
MYRTDSAADMSLAITAKGVTKTFTQWQRDNTGRGMIRNLIKPEKRVIKALDNVSFTVTNGEFVAYAGPNGAGKSTTMKLLAGMLLPTSGNVGVLSLSPARDRRTLMHRLGVLFGNRTELWWDHPIIQSFEWKKVVWNIDDITYRKNIQMVTELLDLAPLLKTFARELSLGQRMRADLAMMLLHSPSLIILDEPTLGLDVVAKRQMIDFLKRINRENGVTIIVTSHDMDDLEEMADRILMISSGKIVYDGRFDGLREIAGDLTRIGVASSAAPDIPGGTHLSSEGGVHAYEVDLTQVSIRTVMRILSEMDGVTDVEIRKAPIEQVIARLYQKWR